MSNALITGGAGFIGLHLARRLVSDGWRVALLDNFERGRKDADLQRLAEDPRVDIVDADLLEPTALASLSDGYSHIFHFAAILGVQNVIERPRAVLESNVRLTVNALDPP